MLSQKADRSSRESRRLRETCADPVTPASLDGGYGWVVVLASFICNMIVDGIPTSFGIFMDSYGRSFQEDKGTVTYANSVNVGMHLLVGPLVGALCKKYSCRAVCIAGSILSTAAFLLSIFARNTLVFTLLYGLLGGTGFGMIYISTVILVSYYFELKRSLAVSISICGSGFGMFVFAPLSNYLLHKFKWQGAHLIFAGLTFSCTIFSLLLVPLEYFLPNTTESDVTSEIHEKCPVRPNTSRTRRSQVSYNAALSSVFEDKYSEEENNDTDTDFQKNKENYELVISTSEHLIWEDHVGDLKANTELDLSINTISESAETTKLKDWESLNSAVPAAYAIARAQQLRKKEILKILLFTRIVLKKDCSTGSKLPLFSRRILKAMKSLRDMSGNETENLEYEVLDFYEIKKSKSEDLTLLQHYLSHVELNLGDSLPSDLNHYAYIVNELGMSMGRLEEVTGTRDSDNSEDTTLKVNPINEHQNDVNTQQGEDDKDPVMYAASGRNVKSLPVLDQINEDSSEDSCLRQTQSNKALTIGVNKEQEEHENFVRNLFCDNVTPRNFWTDDELETTNSDYSFHSESVIKEKVNCAGNGGVDQTTSGDYVVEMRTKKKDSGDSAWWNSSSSSVRKDMYYTGSIFTLKEYEGQADEEYRKRNTVQVSLLQEMWDRDLLSNPVFILYITSNIFLLAGYYIPYVFLVNTAISRGIDKDKASFLMSAVGLSNMLGRIFFGFLDSWKLVDSLLLNNISLLVSALAILGFPYCSHFHDYLLTSVAIGFSQACVACLTTTLLVQFFTLDKLTNSFGILQLFRGVATILGVPCGGLIYKWTQSYVYTYWVSAGFYALSIILGCLMHVVLKTSRSQYRKVACRQEFQTNGPEENKDPDHMNYLYIRHN